MLVGNVCRVQDPGSRSKYSNVSKNSQKNSQKIRKNWGMVPIVGDDVDEHLQGPGSISKYGNLAKNSQILTKKYEMVWNVRPCLQGPS